MEQNFLNFSAKMLRERIQKMRFKRWVPFVLLHGMAEEILGHTLTSVSSFRTNSNALFCHARGEGGESRGNGDDGGELHCIE